MPTECYLRTDLVRWASYIFFRYTGQVSFLPLKSAQGSSKRRPNDPNQPPSCSPKSMYRLAVTVSEILETACS